MSLKDKLNAISDAAVKPMKDSDGDNDGHTSGAAAPGAACPNCGTRIDPEKFRQFQAGFNKALGGK